MDNTHNTCLNSENIYFDTVEYRNLQYNQVGDDNSYRTNSIPCYFGKITREEAERLLSAKINGLFLVRQSLSFPGEYSLSVCFENKIDHYRIKKVAGKLTVDDEDFYNDLEELIAHYKHDADGLSSKLDKPLFNMKKES